MILMKKILGRFNQKVEIQDTKEFQALSIEIDEKNSKILGQLLPRLII